MARRKRGTPRRPANRPEPGLAPAVGRTTPVRPVTPRSRPAAAPASKLPLVLLVAALAVAAIGGVLLFRPFGLGGGAPSAAPGGRGTNCPTSQPPALGTDETRDVTIETRQGSFQITVHGSWSPIAAGNFVALASCGFYDGVVFHRLVPGFVIQGGDPTGSGSGGPGYTIQDEPVTQTYRRGLVAMARRPTPNTQGSQFFVILSDDARLSLEQANNYAIFGEVTHGMETVDAIAAMPNSGRPENRALDPVAMDEVTVSAPGPSQPAPSEPGGSP